MTYRRRTPGILLVLTLLAACEGSPADPGEPPRAFTTAEAAVTNASNSFGLRLFSGISAAAADANVLVSPLSASMALGMTANGARAQTLDAMRSVLGFGVMPEDSVNAAYHGLIGQLRARDRKVEFKLANSIWHERTFEVQPVFLDMARESFDAQVRALDFADPGAPGTISRWAEDATGGRIRDLIRSIDPAEVMFLVNAVYFKAPWSTPFEPNGTRPEPFRRANGSTVSVPMMHGDATRPWLRNADIEAVELLYGDSAFSMVVMAPAEGRTLDDVVSGLDATRWQEWMAGLQPGRILVSLPKFRFAFGQPLTGTLKDLGMSVAFDRDRADFGRINATRQLFLSRVEHKTFIDVHELGTEAAAATAVGVGVTSLPPAIVFDRPFLFVIRERESGSLLFIGRVGDPLASQGA